MSVRRRLPFAADALVALAMLAALYGWGLSHRLWRDFITEAGPALDRLLHGDVHGFLALSPAYGGSLVLRGPLMALGGALGGWAGAYRLSAVGCMAAAAVLALVLAAHMRAIGRSAAARWLLIAVLVANPASAWALKHGHPEEMLTAALAVGCVLAAMRGRPVAAGLLLGVAIASKQWALVAAPVALAVSERGRRRLIVSSVVGAAVVIAPVALASAGSLISDNTTAATAPITFHAEQIWWALGMYWMRPMGGPHSDIFSPAPTSFVAHASHPLIVALPFALASAWWLRRRLLVPSDALLLLALVLLLRCLLDPWNNVYYHVPFLFALAAWEAHDRPGLPVLSLLASALVWTSFQSVDIFSSGDMSCLFYLSWALPAAAVMLWRSLRLPRPAILGAGRGALATPRAV